ncbi:MAG: TRAP transporter large permease [Desulfatiglans sp.]|jgi:C4-dicarboxylate transporter DctM subunit|nr:TRAP transporter large permease [Thermodesulfobacteriota bacterium]MEE4352139.1 TRAP transporter large permease [Desulfatiglans sp.]
MYGGGILGFLFLSSGAPVFVAFGIAAILIGVFSLQIPWGTFGVKGVGMVMNSTLLAIPLFVFAGNIALECKAARYLIDFFDSLVRQIRGGSALVLILSCGFFGAITGSILAAIVAIGGLMIPIMEEQGYPRNISAALTVASSTLAMLIPPSNVFIIYGFLAEVSVTAMFLAGILPGLLLIVILSVVAQFFSGTSVKERQKATKQEKWSAFKKALPFAIMPIVVLGGIYSGAFTPTEAAGIAVWYTIFIGAFVYRTLGWKDIYKSAVSTVSAMGMIFMIAIAAGILTMVFTQMQIPQILTQAISGYLSEYIFLLMCTLVMFFLGMFLDGFIVMFVVIPVLLPTVRQLGIDPIHFGIVLCSAASIGLATPPVCIGLYTAASISNTSSQSMIKPLIPFVGCLVILCVFVIFLPGLSTYLPSLFQF